MRSLWKSFKVRKKKMDEKILLGIGSVLLPVAIGGVGIIISMRVELAVLKEKVAYQANQIRDLLKKIPRSD